MKPRFHDVVHGWSWACGDCGASVYADKKIGEVQICPCCGQLPSSERPVQHDDFALLEGWDLPKATTYSIKMTDHQRVGLALAVSAGNEVKVIFEADGTVGLTVTAPQALADDLGLRPYSEGEPSC